MIPTVNKNPAFGNYPVFNTLKQSGRCAKSCSTIDSVICTRSLFMSVLQSTIMCLSLQETIHLNCPMCSACQLLTLV